MPRKEKVAKPRDPLLDNQAVRLYRDIVHLQLNHVQRECVADAVTNIRIWEATLAEFMLKGYPPKRVDLMLKTYREMTNENGRH